MAKLGSTKTPVDLAERGMVDEVVARADLPARLGAYLRMRMPQPARGSPAA